MMMRYAAARAQGKERYRQVLKEDADLLEQYGLKLLCVQGGLTVARIEDVEYDKGGRPRLHPWHRIEINEKVWKWVRPLLLKLREFEASTEEVVQLLAAK